jgi:hypothetical protein
MVMSSLTPYRSLLAGWRILFALAAIALSLVDTASRRQQSIRNREGLVEFSSLAPAIG